MTHTRRMQDDGVTDATTDPARTSWVAVPAASDFPVQNLPFGTFRRARAEAPHIGVAIGDQILDLHELAVANVFAPTFAGARDTLAAPTLNALLAHGRPAWRRLRERLAKLLAAGDTELHVAGLVERALVAQRDVQMTLPIVVADYVDFYASLEHATNAGKIFRPHGEPLTPNWRWLPVAYHGRAATVIAGGSDVIRPRGQIPGADGPLYAATQALDFELEMAFVTGDGPAPAAPIPVERARETIFGLALLNDWSARDVQAWEAQPLGPFLGKSFATSLGPWIVTLDALEPFRVAAPLQEPAPLRYLATHADEAYDVTLDVTLASQSMRERGVPPQRVTRVNFQTMYWTLAQMLAHASSNGARIRAGDVFGSGTVSGGSSDSLGSMLELTWRGTRPLALADRTTRSWLADGDEVVMRARCAAAGATSIGFGSLAGTIVPAPT